MIQKKCDGKSLMNFCTFETKMLKNEDNDNLFLVSLSFSHLLSPAGTMQFTFLFITKNDILLFYLHYTCSWSISSSQNNSTKNKQPPKIFSTCCFIFAISFLFQKWIISSCIPLSVILHYILYTCWIFSFCLQRSAECNIPKL